MRTTLLLVCFVVFLVICEIGFGVARPQRGGQRGQRAGRENKKSGKPAKMCYGVVRRSGQRPAEINCTRYDVDVDADLFDIYKGDHEDVFREWIELIQAMTSREMESDDEDPEEEGDDDEDELTIMCERKLCFMRKLREHRESNDVPDFCKEKSAEDWEELKQAQRPERQLGEPAPLMTVERYTTIFCVKAYNPEPKERANRNKGDKEVGRGRWAGKKRRGGKGGERRGGGKGKARKGGKDNDKQGARGRGGKGGAGGRRGEGGRRRGRPNKRE